MVGYVGRGVAADTTRTIYILQDTTMQQPTYHIYDISAALVGQTSRSLHRHRRLPCQPSRSNARVVHRWAAPGPLTRHLEHSIASMHALTTLDKAVAG